MQETYRDQKQVNNDILFEVTQQYFADIMHRSIGALTFRDKFNRLGKGTATLISKDIILTVAHNIYDKEYGYEYTQFKFYLAPHKVAQDYYEIQSWRYLPEFKTCLKRERIRYDYAIMKLKPKMEKPISYNEFLLLESVCPKCQKQGFTLSIFGYPSEQSGYPPNYIPLDPQFKKFKINQYGLTCEKRVVSIDFSQLRLTYSMNTYPGQSGSAIICSNRIIAVHNAAGNFNEAFNIGRIMSADVINILRQWCGEVKGQLFKVYKHPHQAESKQQVRIRHNNAQYSLDYKLIKDKSVEQVLHETLPSPQYYYCLLCEDFLLKPEDSFNTIEELWANCNGSLQFSILKDSARFYLFAKMYHQYKDIPLHNYCDIPNIPNPENKEQYARFMISKLYSDRYSQINRFLRQNLHLPRSQHKNIDWIRVMKYIVEMIKVLRNLKKQPGFVFRGLPYQFDLKAQKIMEFPNFTSTSSSEKVARMFAKKQFHIIKQYNGRQISRYSPYPNERETLLLPFTKFYCEKMVQNNKISQCKLIELSGPIFYSDKMLIWIEDQPTQWFKSLQFMKDCFNFEILYIPSFFIFTKWYEEYGWLLKWRETKVKIVLNLSVYILQIQRGQLGQLFSGLSINGVNNDVVKNGIQFQFLKWFYMQKSCKNQVLVFCQNPKQYLKKANQYKINEKCQFTNSFVKIEQFISFQE